MNKFGSNEDKNIEVDLTNPSEAVMFIASNIGSWNLQWIGKVVTNMDYF